MKLKIFLLFVFCVLSSAVWAQEDFARLPVVYEGRLQPLDSFARGVLRDIHGSESIEGQSASVWIGRVIANPKGAVRQPLFFVAKPAAKAMLGLADDQKFFSAHDLSEAFSRKENIAENLLQQKPENLTPEQAEILRLYDGLLSFTTLLEGKGIPFDANPVIEPDDAARFEMEILYNKIHPFHWALALYGLGLALAFCAMVRNTPLMNFAAFGTVLAGCFAHGAGVMMRVYVLQRPPVGTLYESLLFVSLVCVMCALAMVFRSGRALYLMAGALAGFVLLAVAPVTLPPGQSMQMLSAVLNTNFWLATHVLCITAGYGLCIMTAIFAHCELMLKKQKLQKIIYILSLFSLLLTCVGTILGGIWADQSWGRFWGWDPKENGALLIVLWLVWLQHGRLSRHLNVNAFLAGTAFLNVIVALSWFGVNLLNVGLHSYGFTTGMAAGLFVFCAAESLLIAALWWRRRV